MHFIGNDVSKLSLDLAWFNPAAKRWSNAKKVSNTKPGWAVLVRWAQQQTQAPVEEICIVLEATGVYHLKAAAYLSQAGLNIIVANPGRSAEYAKSQNQLNKSDQLDARSLQRYGSQLQKVHWFVPDLPQISQLKALLSRLRQLDKDLQRERNRLEKCAFVEDSGWAEKSIRRHIKAIVREQTLSQEQIDLLIDQNPVMRLNQELMCSIKGIGKKTSQWLLPLLSNQRFSSAREVGAFLGLAPCHRQSGTSLSTGGRLSGRGDEDLRARLYMPAMSAARTDPEMKAFYQQLLARGKPKKVALIAVMRKLIHLCYGVINTQTPYQENYAA